MFVKPANAFASNLVILLLLIFRARRVIHLFVMTLLKSSPPFIDSSSLPLKSNTSRRLLLNAFDSTVVTSLLAKFNDTNFVLFAKVPSTTAPEI